MKLLNHFWKISTGLLFFCTIICSCSNVQKKTGLGGAATQPSDSVALLNKEFEKKSKNDSVLFSTADLINIEWVNAQDFDFKAVNYKGEIYESQEDVCVLQEFPNFCLVIERLVGGDYYFYALRIAESNVMKQNGLNISPKWSDPDEEEYRKINFNIFSDYTIRIETEEKLRNSKEGSFTTQFFRISNVGEFYEVSESDL